MRREQCAAGTEILWQRGVVHRLDHFDRNQLVVLAVEIPEILLQQGDPIFETRCRHALASLAVLLVRDRRGGHAAAVVLRRVQREAAPAGTDLQEVIARTDIEPVEQQAAVR